MLFTFLNKVKYTISNAIVIVSYEISYNITILTLIPLYSNIKIKMVEVNYIKILKLQGIIMWCGY